MHGQLLIRALPFFLDFDLADLFQSVIALDQMSEYRVLSVQVRTRRNADIKLGIAAVDIFIAAEADRPHEVRFFAELGREVGGLAAAGLDDVTLDHAIEFLAVVKAFADEFLNLL